jgi:Tfp pilus assembly protein PilZ
MNINEAPSGFYPVKKSDFKHPEGLPVPNICNNCDARKLCVENKDGWCSLNPCMSHSRKDGVGVVFKKKEDKL